MTILNGWNYTFKNQSPGKCSWTLLLSPSKVLFLTCAQQTLHKSAHHFSHREPERKHNHKEILLSSLFSFPSTGFYLPLLFSFLFAFFLDLFSFCRRRLLFFFFFLDERHLFGGLQRTTGLEKSLVLQSCSFSILYPIWKGWSKESEPREKLKDVWSVVNNTETNPQTHTRLC